ncbi:MAG: hypothetical protein LBM00_02755 [Deltaproteobacteria bacterium]|jgi:hypothetical protein|nr:hypothetical protein [Deltaproteobacteria bacterium]
MKIENDVIRALQQDEAHRKPKTGPAGSLETGAFESLLADQLQRFGNSAAAPDSLAPADASGGQSATALALLLRQAEESNRLAETEDTEDGLVAGDLEKLLNKWDEYAGALSRQDSDGGLRGVYALLQGMSAELNDLKAACKDLLAKNPALDSLVNELDVLTATETIKFNRGDYLA